MGMWKGGKSSTSSMRSAKGRGFFVGAVLIFCICMVGGFYVSPLWAQEDVSAEINDLNQDIKTNFSRQAPFSGGRLFFFVEDKTLQTIVGRNKKNRRTE